MRRKILSIILVAMLTVSILPSYTTSAAGIEKKDECFSAQDFVVPLPKQTWWEPVELPEKNFIVNEVNLDIEKQYETVEVTVSEMVSIGTYYITAYCSCSKCCWPSTNKTASGTTCHYESDPNDPTTCAIDRKLHHFGDTFYLKSEGRMYVAEDTGSAVKGKHIDLYFPDHSYVQSYGSHYETVYVPENTTFTPRDLFDFNQFNEFDISYRSFHYKRSEANIIKNFCPKKITQNFELLDI